MSDVTLNLTSDCRLFLRGQLTFDTVKTLWEESQPVLEKLSSIEVDLMNVTRGDSAGLALLIEWYYYAKQQGKSIIFKNLPTQLFNMAKISGVDQILSLS